MTQSNHPNRLTGMAFFVAAAICFASLALFRPAEIGSIQRGIDQCASCGMTIEDVGFAAARVVMQNARPRTFLYDDLGCMLDADRENEGGTSHGCYVQDFNGTGWIDAKQAWFVMDAKNHTPMGSGILAFRKKPAAGALTFDEVAKARHAFMKAKYGGE
ncbi:MAG: nitrous oxide reductase accessory protein NosL [Phycisphaeraceae bacterium]|nr:nitrous oxide reductase accessory protein NosL [Phycisphaeraceae bacterium]